MMREITLRYAGSCGRCGRYLARGDRAWHVARGRVECAGGCADQSGRDPGADYSALDSTGPDAIARAAPAHVREHALAIVAGAREAARLGVEPGLIAWLASRASAEGAALYAAARVLHDDHAIVGDPLACTATDAAGPGIPLDVLDGVIAIPAIPEPIACVLPGDGEFDPLACTATDLDAFVPAEPVDTADMGATIVARPAFAVSRPAARRRRGPPPVATSGSPFGGQS